MSIFSRIKALCDENRVRMVDFKMVDLDGRWRHVTIPVERFNDELLTNGVGFDGSNYGYAPVEKSDMVFIPDPDTAHLDPFTAIPTLSMTGSVFTLSGAEHALFDQYPPNVCRNALGYMSSLGIADQMRIAPEFEFHVFDHVAYAAGPEQSFISIEASQAGWTESGRVNASRLTPKGGGYHISSPQDTSFDLRNQMCMLLADWGVDVKYHHHEVGGSGQLEIEVELGDMLDMADKTMIIKYVIKNAAAQNGQTATFMPKPIPGEAGNGMHVHMLLMKDGKPLFYDENGYSGLSREAHWFIGGLLEHASSLAAFTNPSTNSFKRLIPGFEAPVTLGYATSNRSAVVRIPAYARTPESKRFELRCPDATCNPYYAYAAILMAGLDGFRKQIDPQQRGWGPYDFNLYDLPPEEQKKIRSLPRSLDEALDALEADHDYLTAGGVFPERLIEVWCKRKRKESNQVLQIPSPAEFAMYYNL